MDHAPPIFFLSIVMVRSIFEVKRASEFMALGFHQASVTPGISVTHVSVGPTNGKVGGRKQKHGDESGPGPSCVDSQVYIGLDWIRLRDMAHSNSSERVGSGHHSFGWDLRWDTRPCFSLHRTQGQIRWGRCPSNPVAGSRTTAGSQPDVTLAILFLGPATPCGCQASSARAQVSGTWP